MPTDRQVYPESHPEVVPMFIAVQEPDRSGTPEDVSIHNPETELPSQYSEPLMIPSPQYEPDLVLYVQDDVQ
jgi:hypothetical protein